MATALQKQLAVIAASSTHQLDLKAQKAAHSRSLLFEPRVAAAQDFDSLYQICLEGFRELCHLDHRFLPFSKTLFSEQSKVEERTQMTTKDNDELNLVLEGFLGLIGPRLLLKPAVKATEWLVRRFRIHEYNTEFTILTFLPYHEMPIFKTLLSILPPASKIPQTLRFLASYQTTLVNPPRAAILYAAAHNTSFLSALNGYVLKVVRAHQQSTSLLSFWASAITQAVNGMLGAARSGRETVQRKQHEDILLLVLPVLNEGLTLVHSPEMVIACYMIIMVLVAKTNLEEKVLDSLLEAVVKTINTDTEISCLVCLAVIAQERRRVAFPKSVAKRIVKLAGLPRRLPELSQQCRIDRLSVGYILSRIDRAGAHDLTVVEDAEKVLSMNILDDKLCRLTLSALAKFVHKASKSDDMDANTRSRLVEMISRISHSESFALAWNDALRDASIDVETLEMQLGAILQVDGQEEDRQGDDGALVHGDIDANSTFNAAYTSLKVKNEGLIPDSFLNVEAGPLFNEISRTVTIAARSISPTNQLEKLFSLPLLRADHAFDSSTYFSCLLRLAVSCASGTVRTLAWRQIQKRFPEPKQALSYEGIPDMQAFLPYAITALGDSNAKVRRASAECIVLLKRINKSRKAKDSQKDQAIPIWAQKDLYDSSSRELQWLSQDESVKIVNAISRGLDECVLDSRHIEQLLESLLTGRSKDERGWKDHEVVELKSSLRTMIATFLGDHAARSPVLAVKSSIFMILGRLGKYGSKGRTLVLPEIRTWFALSHEGASVQCHLENMAVSDIDRSYLSAIHPNDSEGVRLVISLLDGTVRGDGRTYSSAAANKLKEIWSDMRSDAQEKVATALLDMSLQISDQASAAQSRENAINVLKSVELSPHILDAFLRSISSAAQMPDQPPPTKRRRTSQAEKVRPELIDTADLTRQLRRLTMVLEIIEGSKLEKHPGLIKGLFHTLGDLHHYRSQSGSNLVYLQGLVIESLLSIVRAQDNEQDSKIDPSAIRTDLLVDCIRQSSSPQVQNSALLLISSIASWQPELVLHSVMPIFTFMGSTLLRQSDDYSVHVIDQTISRVVPPLVTSLRLKNQNFALGISELLLSFVAAYEHIPLHRRLSLFSQLLKTLGPDGSLAATSALLFDRYPNDLTLPRFITQLIKQFDAAVTLKAYNQYLDLVEDGLKPRRQLTNAFFGFKDKSAAEVEQALVTLLDGLVTMLEDENLKMRLDRIFEEDKSEVSLVRQYFLLLVERIIIASNQVKSQAALHQAYRRLLLASLDLLPTAELVKSADALLNSPYDQVLQSTLRAVQIRAKSTRQNEDAAIRALLSLAPRIVQLLQSSKSTNLRQVAVACIDQISESFGKRDVNAMLDAAGAIAGPNALCSDDLQLQVMSLHCLASMVEVLREEFISLLPVVVPRVFDHLHSSISGSEGSLHEAGYALLCAITEHLPFVFSGQYFAQSLEISHASATADLTKSQDSRRHFYVLAARSVDSKHLFAAIEKTWRSALLAGPQALDEQAELLTLALKTSSKSAVAENTTTLFNILLHGLDFRRILRVENKQEQYAETQVEKIERQMIDATITMILKLSDATFRPLFIKMVDWMSKKLPKTDVTGRMLRSISFYRFLCVFFERLKSLVTSYSSYVLDHAARTLNTVSVKDQDGLLLCELILNSLRKSFEHDEDDFWQSPSHFNLISEPLASQLNRESSHLTKGFVIPAITEFAAAASSAEHHKDLNARIMKSMRAHESHSRLAAIECEQSLTERLGEEWLSLLPEMLPYISELQDDDNETVEREVQRWIKRIEEILGESLDTMLQ